MDYLSATRIVNSSKCAACGGQLAYRIGKDGEYEILCPHNSTEPVNLVEVAPPAPTKVQTEVGTAGITRNRKWEMVDFAAVPDEFKILDAVKIGKLVRAGIGSISGIRIWTEEGLRVTTR